MAKGGYSFIAYPDSSDITEICSFLSNMGAGWAYILHDRDKKEDGSPAKPHYHVVSGWEVGKPTWQDFKRFCKDHKLFAPSPGECVVRSFDGIVEKYFDHHAEDGKAVYSHDDIVYSDDWGGTLYDTADATRNKERKAKKVEKAGTVAQVLSIVKKEQLTEFSEVCDYLMEHQPELVETLISSAFVIKSYIDSSRNSGALRSKYEDDLCSLTSQLASLRDGYDVLKHDCKLLGEERDQYKRMLQCYQENAGELPPALYEF